MRVDSPATLEWHKFHTPTLYCSLSDTNKLRWALVSHIHDLPPPPHSWEQSDASTSSLFVTSSRSTNCFMRTMMFETSQLVSRNINVYQIGWNKLVKPKLSNLCPAEWEKRRMQAWGSPRLIHFMLNYGLAWRSKTASMQRFERLKKMQETQGQFVL